MSNSERVRHGVKRRQFVGLCDSCVQPPALLIEGEPEERAALTLDCERLVERLAIEPLTEVDQHGLGLTLDVRDAASKMRIAGALITHPRLVKCATGDLCDGLIKGV